MSGGLLLSGVIALNPHRCTAGGLSNRLTGALGGHNPVMVLACITCLYGFEMVSHSNRVVLSCLQRRPVAR